MSLQKKLVKALNDAGVKILAGTDGSLQANFPVIPGFSIHLKWRKLALRPTSRLVFTPPNDGMHPTRDTLPVI